MKKKTASRKPKVKERRMTKFEMITQQSIQDYSNQSTKDITRYRDILSCQLKSVEELATECSARLLQAKLDRSILEARILGLGIVIDRR